MYLTVLKALAWAIAALAATGDIEILFGLDAGVGFLELALAAFAFTYVLGYPSDIFRSIVKTKANYIFLVAIIFAGSGLFYVNSSYELPVLNYKLLICILFFCVLTSFFLRFPEQLHRSLIVYSVTSIVYVIAVVYLIPGASSVVKGQLIVLGENPNSTSSRIAVAAVYLFALLVQNPLNLSKLRFLFIPGICVLLILIVESGSRGSLLAVIAAFFVLIMFSKIRTRYRIIIGGGTAVMAPYIGLYMLSQDGLADRWLSAADGDTAGRTEIWRDALSIYFNNPFFGTGEAGYFQEIYYLRGTYIDTHNVFLYVAVCGGIFSLVLFSIFLLGLFRRSRTSVRAGDVLPAVLLVYMILIASKTGAVLTYFLMWYIFAVVFVYPQVSLALLRNGSPNSGKTKLVSGLRTVTPAD